MLRNNKGFSLLETLIASSIFFFLITAIFPQIYTVAIERKNLRLQQLANQWLNEHLFEASVKGEESFTDLSLHEGIPFYIKIERNKSGVEYKGCITWSNFSSKEEEICGTVK